MVTDGKWTFGGEHAIVYTDFELCCTHDTCIMLLNNVTMIIKRKTLKRKKKCNLNMNTLYLDDLSKLQYFCICLYNLRKKFAHLSQEINIEQGF